MRPVACTSSLLLLLATPLISALSSSDLANVFGADATGLTGASVQLPQFEFSVVLNGTFALISLNATSSTPSEVGWMGTGTGTTMGNSDYLITWPNLSKNVTAASSSPWTLSHRAAFGMKQPVVASTDAASSSAALFSYLPELSTTDPASPFTVITYLRPLFFASGLSASTFQPLQPIPTDFIYASGSKSPGNSAESTSFSYHDQAHATILLDLSTPISLRIAPPVEAPIVVVISTAASPNTSSSSVAATPSVAAGSSNSSSNSTSVSSPLPVIAASKMTRRDIYLIAHAVLGSAALLLFTPIAILIGRYLRGLSGWFPVHAGLQLLAASMIIASCALGWIFSEGQHPSDVHKRVGLSIFSLVLVQVGLGAFAHRIPAPNRADLRHSRFPTLFQKHPVRLIHIFLGIVVTVLGFVQIRGGLQEFTMWSDAQYAIPLWAVIVFWVISMLVAVLYIAGWVLEATGRTRSTSQDIEGVEKIASIPVTFDQSLSSSRRSSVKTEGLDV